MNYKLLKLSYRDTFEIILFGVFTYAAISKLFFPLKFTAALLRIVLLPEFLVGILVLVIPIFELAVVVMGFFVALRKFSYSILFGLLAIFTFYLAGQWVYDPKNSCGCGGILDSLTIPQHLAVNIALLVIAGCLIYESRN